MAQLGEQSSVVALQRAREIREASMPSDTLERGTLLPQERVGKSINGLHGLKWTRCANGHGGLVLYS